VNDREKRWRKPEASGIPITLADGEAWLFPRPKVGLSALVDSTGRPRFAQKSTRSFGADYDALVDAFIEADDGVNEAEALLALAVDLLGRNYDLAPSELVTLLPRWFDDDANQEMWRAIADAALGRAPKPTPVG
jgi:hypothetical protein